MNQPEVDDTEATPVREPSLMAGRVSARDPAGVRRRILSAGMELFAAHGFAGTSMRDVARAAQVSVSLIQHHFRTKEALYAEVKQRAFASYVRAQSASLGCGGPSVGPLVTGGLRRFSQQQEAAPEWSRLTAWGMLEGDNRAWPGEDNLMDRLAAEVRTRQADGQIDAAVDPELLLIAAGGLMSAWSTYAQRYAHRLEHLGTEEERESAYLSLCLKLLLREPAKELRPAREIRQAR